MVDDLDLVFRMNINFWIYIHWHITWIFYRFFLIYSGLISKSDIINNFFKFFKSFKLSTINWLSWAEVYPPNRKPIRRHRHIIEIFENYWNCSIIIWNPVLLILLFSIIKLKFCILNWFFNKFAIQRQSYSVIFF